MDREQLLSEFIDAWNAGERPDVEAYLSRAEIGDRDELASEILAFVSFAPTPSYSDETLRAIEAEVPVAERRGVLASLLQTARERVGLGSQDLAAALVAELELGESAEPKTASYLERLETGDLDGARVSRKVFEALGRLLRVPREQLEGAADLPPWGALSAPAAAPVFRAKEPPLPAAARSIDLLADALTTPGKPTRDAVDELFLGGR
jgi:hypothetical protein